MTFVTDSMSIQARRDGLGYAAIHLTMASGAALCGSSRFNSLQMLGVVKLRRKTD
jgi:hypothetical protein